MRLSEYRHVLLCALCYGSAVVLARFAFEDGSNAATVVSVRCAFAALAIGVALRIGGSERHTSGRERALLLGLGLVFALGVFSFYKAIEILRVPLAILSFYVNPLIIGVFGALVGFERLSGRMLLFALLSLVREVGLHWVFAFLPFFFMAAALALSARQLRASVLYLGVFSRVHVVAALSAAALPLDTWKHSRFYDGIVFHFRINEVVSALKTFQPEFELAADGYSPAVTASVQGGRYVFVFGTASSHARHDDLITDFRSYAGKNILVFRKNPPQDGDYRPYFSSVEYGSMKIAGATFHLVFGRGFQYEAYRDGVLAEMRDRYYRIPAFLPQGGCSFCERYFQTACPVRGG